MISADDGANSGWRLIHNNEYAGHSFTAYDEAATQHIRLTTGNSDVSGILSKPVRILIWYKE
jgi:hypothetical protein